MTQPTRRFLLGDVLVLIAAVAVMLSADRAIHWIWETLNVRFGDIPSYDYWETRRMACSLGLAGFSLPVLCSTLFRQADRERLRRGVPGLFVHAAVATVVALRLAGWVTRGTLCTLLKGWPRIYQPRWTVEVLDYLRDDLARDTAIAVLAGWLAMKLVGRWNPEWAWDAKLGGLVGCLWIALYFGAPLFALVQ